MRMQILFVESVPYFQLPLVSGGERRGIVLATVGVDGGARSVYGRVLELGHVRLQRTTTSTAVGAIGQGRYDNTTQTLEPIPVTHGMRVC